MHKMNFKALFTHFLKLLASWMGFYLSNSKSRKGLLKLRVEKELTDYCGAGGTFPMPPKTRKNHQNHQKNPKNNKNSQKHSKNSFHVFLIT